MPDPRGVQLRDRPALRYEQPSLVEIEAAWSGAVRIVFIANSTFQPIATRFDADVDVVVSQVGDLVPWLVDPSCAAADPATDVVVVVPDGDTVLPPLGSDGFADELFGRLDMFASKHRDKLVIAATPLATHRSSWANADAADPGGRFAARSRWLAALVDLVGRHDNMAILDLEEMAEAHGRSSLTTDTYWYLGRIRFSGLGFDLIADEVLTIVRGYEHQAKKVLVLDLDNTLWGGVLGEDGVGGIQVSEDGLGKAYRDFQRHLLRLQQSGVLLAVVSKNDAGIVDDVLEHHPMMSLRPKDFVAVRAGWGNKADEIRSLADSLSLGLGSFVFVDDSAAERLLVRTELPEVHVPDMPQRPELLSQGC